LAFRFVLVCLGVSGESDFLSLNSSPVKFVAFSAFLSLTRAFLGARGCGGVGAGPVFAVESDFSVTPGHFQLIFLRADCVRSGTISSYL